MICRKVQILILDIEKLLSQYFIMHARGYMKEIILTITEGFSLYCSIYQKKYQIKVCKIRLVLVEFRHKERGYILQIF